MDSKIIKKRLTKNAAVIVAHPDDEALCTGGIILMHPEINWTILMGNTSTAEPATLLLLGLGSLALRRKRRA